MIQKLLKVCGLPVGKYYKPGINLKGDYLSKYGFEVGDMVKVEISENKIIIEKNDTTKIVTQMGIKNPYLLNLIDELGLNV